MTSKMFQQRQASAIERKENVKFYK